MRIYMDPAQPAQEEDGERQQHKEATVAFVDNIELREDRRSFWLKQVHIRVVNQGRATAATQEKDYVVQAVGHYRTLTGATSLKTAATTYCPEGPHTPKQR